MDWIFPSTLFLFAVVAWILALVFTKKQMLGIFAAVSAVIATIGLLLLIQRGYEVFAGALICLLISHLIFYFGFDFTFSRQTEAQGPLAELMGKEGTVKEPLMPKGTVEIQSQEYPATSEGLYVAPGSEIKVIRCAANILVVEKLHE